MKLSLDQTRILTPEDWKEKILPVLGSFSVRDRTLIRFLAATGLRRAECAGLDVSDILPYRPGLYLVRVRAGKGGEGRVVPLSAPEVIDLVRLYVGLRKEGPLFLSRVGGGGRLSGKGINDICLRVGEKAGIHLHAHALRHFALSSIQRAGGDLTITAQIAGHASTRVTEAYYIDPWLCKAGEVARKAVEQHDFPIHCVDNFEYAIIRNSTQSKEGGMRSIHCTRCGNPGDITTVGLCQKCIAQAPEKEREQINKLILKNLQRSRPNQVK